MNERNQSVEVKFKHTYRRKLGERERKKSCKDNEFLRQSHYVAIELITRLSITHRRRSTQTAS